MGGADTRLEVDVRCRRIREVLKGWICLHETGFSAKTGVACGERSQVMHRRSSISLTGGGSYLGGVSFTSVLLDLVQLSRVLALVSVSRTTVLTYLQNIRVDLDNLQTFFHT